jgi:uncharacterized protein (DUF1697 family)
MPPRKPETIATLTTAYVALLRAVNVGGTSKLPMSELKAMCEACDFDQVKTYIASGNVIFRSALPETRVKAQLEAKLRAYAKKPVNVRVRTSLELERVLAGNPFPKAAPNRTVAVFLDEAPPRDAAKHAVGKKNEEIGLGIREIYIHYGDGMADSKLKIPAAKDGTARNMNTVKKLSEMLTRLSESR